jgi:hypothetical protein
MRKKVNFERENMVLCTELRTVDGSRLRVRFIEVRALVGSLQLVRVPDENLPGERVQRGSLLIGNRLPEVI